MRNLCIRTTCLSEWYCTVFYYVGDPDESYQSLGFFARI